MKITCQSCQSKYNVADEKVHGKVVKIRCRKCGTTMVVNGAEGSHAAGAANATHANGASGANGQHGSRAPNGSKGPGMGGATGDVRSASPSRAEAGAWHVNMGDGGQETLSWGELLEAYNTGRITQETFIWSEGMDDWKPLARVDAVVQALHASAAAAEGPRAATFDPEPTAPGAPPHAANGTHAPLTPSADNAAVAADPKRAAVVKRETRARDLFGTHAGDELQASALAATASTAPATDDGKLTGQRNESSVLFSLAVLTKNAEEREPGEGTAGASDSGLIDLQALAAKAESVRPAAYAESNVFTAPLGTPAAPAAPLGVLGALGAGPAALRKSKMPLVLGGGVGMVLLLILGVVIGTKLAGKGAAPAPAASTTASAEPSIAATVEATATASATALPEPTASAAPSATVAQTAPPRPKLAGGGGRHARPPGEGAGSGAAVPGGGGGAKSAPKKGGDCGCNGDLMCEMRCSTH